MEKNLMSRILQHEKRSIYKRTMTGGEKKKKNLFNSNVEQTKNKN